MLKFNHAILVYLSGVIWLLIGMMLMRTGLNLIVGAIFAEGEMIHSYPILFFLVPYLGTPQMAVSLLIGLAFVIGYLKGHFVLAKSVKRGVERIKTFPNPTSIINIYSPSYYILLAGMVTLGISIKYLGVPNDVRGFIDIAIGMALLKGGSLYFRSALLLHRTR